MRHYLALVRKDSDSDFGVEFPDFPGCVSAGATVEEALVNAEEALALHVEGMSAEGEAIPEPTPGAALFGNADLAGAIAYLVPLRPEKGRALRVNITLDEHLLIEIDDAAQREGLTRSGFLAAAAKTKMADHWKPLSAYTRAIVKDAGIKHVREVTRRHHFVVTLGSISGNPRWVIKESGAPLIDVNAAMDLEPPPIQGYQIVKKGPKTFEYIREENIGKTKS